MTPLTWALAGWLGALAYVMVGALVWRVLRKDWAHKSGAPHWCEEKYEPLILRGIGQCSGCVVRSWAIDKSVFWPIYLAYFIVFTTVRSLVYIPFRSAARAIAKPREDSP